MNINLTKEIDDLIMSDDIHVLAIKGPWGIGKTHFWKKYIEETLYQAPKLHIDKNLDHYGYISLFGINNLYELKKNIFENTSPIDEESWFTEKKEQLAANTRKCLNREYLKKTYKRITSAEVILKDLDKAKNTVTWDLTGISINH